MRAVRMTFYAPDFEGARKRASIVCNREGFAGYGNLERVEFPAEMDIPTHKNGMAAYGATFYHPPGA